MRLSKKKFALATIGSLLFAAGGAVSAQTIALTPSSVTGTTTGGSTTPGTIAVVFTNGGANPAGWQADITYNSAVLTTQPTVAAVTPGGHFTTCVVVSPGVIRVASANITGKPPGPHVNGNACNIQFTLPNPTAAGTYPLAITNTVSLAATGNTPGQIVVSAGPQPRYTSNPAAGAPVLIQDVVGGGATTATLTVTNAGLTGAGNLTLNPISGLSGVLGVTPAAPVNIAQGANQVFTISCTAAAAGDTVQTLTITHNGENVGGGAVSPVTHQVTCRGVTGPSAPTAALGTVTNPAVGPINTSGSGSVVVNVTGAGNSVSAGDASLALACTVPAGTASFAITGGANRTINAPATLGANAPPIAFSCVRQDAAVNATISCAQTATPGPNPAALTAQVTCPAGETAPNPGVNPASGTAFNFVGGPSTALSGAITFTNTGGTRPYQIVNCAFSPVVAGYTLTGAFPINVANGGTSSISVGCTTPASPGTALTPTTLTCTSSITAPPAFAPSFPVTCRAEQVVPVPAMSAGGKAMMALLVLLVGLVGFQLYRRNA
jgi:hypothetical protein